MYKGRASQKPAGALRFDEWSPFEITPITTEALRHSSPRDRESPYSGPAGPDSPTPFAPFSLEKKRPFRNARSRANRESLGFGSHE